MCGISGVFSVEINSAVPICERINALQGHRGPDFDQVTEVTPSIVLGHRRLAIVDLSPLGRQPMTDSSGNWIVFNGEIYNSPFLRKKWEKLGLEFFGSSDTEVLLRSLVQQCTLSLEFFQGMYAFVFFHFPSKSLYFVRDPVGIKPLYLVANPSIKAFASEARALESMSKISVLGLSQTGLHSFFSFGCLGSTNTLLDGIQQQAAGTFRIWSENQEIASFFQKEKLFWPLPKNQGEPHNYLWRISSLLEDSFRDHLLADVPVGLFLSSGIDSTILAGLAGEIHPGMEAFTVCFGDHKEFDEDRIAGETARLFGLKHHRIEVPEDKALEGFQAWLKALDQPSIDGLNTFLVSRAVRQFGFKVALSGLGADELFGGYPSFRQIPRWSKILSWLPPMPGWLQNGLGWLFSLGKGRIAWEKTAEALASRGNIRELYRIRRGLFGKNSIRRFLGDFRQDEFAHLPPEDSDPVREVQRLEFSMYMKNMLLRDTDVCSMAHGLEVRVPYLDQRIVDFALSLPGDLIAPKGKPGKWLLRQAMSKYLRDEVVNQPKRGFVLPVGKWLKGPLHGFASELLQKLRCIPQKEVQILWNQFLKEKDGPLQTRIVGLLALAQVESRILDSHS